MTQEEKSLLLKDLSARIPYGVIIQEYNEEHGYSDNALNTIGIGYFSIHEASVEGTWINRIENIKPYLRPMSSMTEEEKKELQEIAVALSYNKDDIIIGTQINSFRQLDGVLDLFNSHHLDWRGLIEKGLAIEAPEEMYN